MGDIQDLRKKLELKINNPIFKKDWSNILRKYNWNLIAKQTLEVYKKLLNIKEY